MSDLRLALRQLRKSPGFAFVAVATLALGIGANTAIFSLVRSVLLNPLPYPEPHRLVALWEDQIHAPRGSIAWPDLQDWQRDNTAFTAIGGYRRDAYTFTGYGDPEMLRGARASAALFEAFGLAAHRGRVFTGEEDKLGAPALAVLSHALWQQRFGGNDSVLGTTILLNDEPHTIIGVMPPEMTAPLRVDFWTQLARRSDEPAWLKRDNHLGIFAIGRLKPGHTLDAALNDLKRISARIAHDHPDTSTGVVAGGRLLIETTVGAYRRGLLLLLGAVGLVLLIACANLANLLLARGMTREAEFAVRAALGGSRLRLVRQLLMESLVLALAGGALGALLASWAHRGIVALSPASLAPFQNAGLDLRMLIMTGVVAVLTALVFGLWPAWKSAAPDLRSMLQGSGRTGSPDRRAARTREGLVVAEIALTLVLLVGAGLLLRSFARIQAVNLGFDARGVLTMRLALPRNTYSTPDRLRLFHDRLLDRVRALPGVKSADLAVLPPLHTAWQADLRPESYPPWPDGQSPRAEMNVISDGYFRTLGIPLLQGRAFGPEDAPASLRAAIIDQAFADRYWPGTNPVGQRVTLGGDLTTVVGVVPTLRVYGYATEPTLVQAYLSLRQHPQDMFQILVRAENDITAAGSTGMERLTQAVRHAVTEIDPKQPVWDVRTLEDRIGGTFATPRLYTYLLTIFAGLAVVLAAIGLYGVLAYQVSRRTREFGIRLALGALQRQVAALVLRRCARLFGFGATLGLLGSLTLSRVLDSLLYRTSVFDPVVIGGVTLLLGAIALVACWLPARRATKVDPMVALRTE